MMIYTSGTTGRPKGAGLTHRSMLASSRAQAEHMRIDEHDLLPLVTPLNHVGGITCGVLTLMAGGGFKGSLAYGTTDDFGFKAAENPVHVHDVHATMLHQLGIDHTKLTYRYSGRDFRLTDVAGNVVKDLLA